MMIIDRIILLLYSVIFMAIGSFSASVPVSWVKSTFFTSNQISIIPTTSGGNFTVDTTYSSALTGNPTKKPVLGFMEMNYQFSLPTVFIRVDVSTFTKIGLNLSGIATYSNFCQIKLYYLAPDPSLTYFFNSFQWSTVIIDLSKTQSNLGTFIGPFNSVNILSISGLTGSGMNTSHEISILVFINGFNLTSTSNCFELILKIRVYNSTRYQLNFTSNCGGMIASFISYSRMFFDVTAIEEFGYQFFQYGTYFGLSNDNSTLYAQLKFFIPDCFLLGISQFKYTSSTAPIIISYNTTLSNLVKTTPNTVFQRLALSYWSLTYRYCPSGYPMFHLETYTCHNICPHKTYQVSSKQMCYDCFYTCKTCTVYPACTSCQPLENRILNGTECLPQLGFYENGTAFAPPCSSNCIYCTNDSVCLTCTNGYTLNSSFYCQKCMPGCSICQNLFNCSVCQNGYLFDILTQNCFKCLILNCINCSNSTNCLVCDVGYYLNSASFQCQMNKAQVQCGDGLYIFPQECDDGNLEEGDGCSSNCFVQTDYSCQNNSGIVPNSVCFYIGDISLNVLYIQKKDKANQLEIFLEIKPKNSKFWSGVDFSKMVTLSNMTNFESYSVKLNDDWTVSIIANYNSTIHNMNMTVQLDPAQSNKSQLSRYSPVRKDFKVIPNDNQLAIYYYKQVYQIAEVTQILVYIIAGSFLFFFMIAIYSDKLVGVEMMAVIQISHLSLIALQGLNPVFNSLTNIWFVNGFNIFLVFENKIFMDSSLPNKVKGLKLYPFFIKNSNCNFFLILIPVAISLICLALSFKRSNFSKKKQLQKISKKFAGQYTFTALMFSGYIVGVAFTLEIMGGFNNLNEVIPIISLVVGFIMLSLMVIYFVLKIIRPKLFGQFHNKFIPTQNIIQGEKKMDIFQQKIRQIIQRFYYNSLLIQRLLIGGCLIIMLNLNLSLLMPIFILLFFLLQCIILKPYHQKKHNIRFVCNILISITILTIYLLYNQINKDKMSYKINIWMYLPLFVCALLLICVIYNAVFLIKSFYQRIRYKKDLHQENQQQIVFYGNKDNISDFKSNINPTLITLESFQRSQYKIKFDQIRKRIKKNFIDKPDASKFHQDPQSYDV